MDSNQFPVAPQSIPAPSPEPAFKPVLEFGARRLRPLWVGVALAVIGFVLSAMLAAETDGEKTARGFIALFALPVLIYYFMIVHRLVRVLDQQPGWSTEYTPAAAVWKHLIPFYGVYFMYVWPRDVESYINWRLGRESRVGLWAFLGLLTGLLLRFADPYMGLLIMIVSLYVLYIPLRRAMATAAPTDMPAPGYNGTLGLR